MHFDVYLNDPQGQITGMRSILWKPYYLRKKRFRNEFSVMRKKHAQKWRLFYEF
mgnify:CR=1 FL=1